MKTLDFSVPYVPGADPKKEVVFNWFKDLKDVEDASYMFGKLGYYYLIEEDENDIEFKYKLSVTKNWKLAADWSK